MSQKPRIVVVVRTTEIDNHFTYEVIREDELGIEVSVKRGEGDSVHMQYVYNLTKKNNSLPVTMHYVPKRFN